MSGDSSVLTVSGRSKRTVSRSHPREGDHGEEKRRLVLIPPIPPLSTNSVFPCERRTSIDFPSQLLYPPYALPTLSPTPHSFIATRTPLLTLVSLFPPSNRPPTCLSVTEFPRRRRPSRRASVASLPPTKSSTMRTALRTSRASSIIIAGRGGLHRRLVSSLSPLLSDLLLWAHAHSPFVPSSSLLTPFIHEDFFTFLLRSFRLSVTRCMLVYEYSVLSIQIRTSLSLQCNRIREEKDLRVHIIQVRLMRLRRTFI